MVALPGSEAEIDAFVAGFEAGTLPKERWTHGAHVLTAACYVYCHGAAAATDRMREKVRRYNEAVGGKNTATSGYHETITVFWVMRIGELLEEREFGSRAEFARTAVERFGERRDLHREFYDFDVLGSVEARAVWVAPTRSA